MHIHFYRIVLIYLINYITSQFLDNISCQISRKILLFNLQFNFFYDYNDKYVSQVSRNLGNYAFLYKPTVNDDL